MKDSLKQYLYVTSRVWSNDINTSKSISIPNRDIFGRMLYGFFDVNSETGIS